MEVAHGWLLWLATVSKRLRDFVQRGFRSLQITELKNPAWEERFARFRTGPSRYGSIRLLTSGRVPFRHVPSREVTGPTVVPREVRTRILQSYENSHATVRLNSTQHDPPSSHLILSWENMKPLFRPVQSKYEFSLSRPVP